MKGRHKTHCLCSFLGNCLFLSHGDTKGWREKFKINLHFHFPQQLGKLSEIYGAFFISPVHNESFVVKIINHVVGSGLLECGCQGTGWNISISGEAESAATWPTQDQYNPANRGMEQGIKCSYYLKSPSERRSYHTLIESSVPHYPLVDLKFSIKTLHHYLQWMPSISGRQLTNVIFTFHYVCVSNPQFMN